MTGAPSLGGMVKLNMTDVEIAGSGAPAWEQTVMTALENAEASSWTPTAGGVTTRSTSSSGTPRWWTSVGAPDQWQQAITQLGGTGGTLSSSVPIPANRLELLAACVAQGTC